MAERQVDIAIVARDEAGKTFKQVARESDETAGAFKRLAQSAKDLNLESRQSGESAFERLLRGGGAIGLATFALEGMKKAADAASESMEKLRFGEIDASQAAGSILGGFVDGVPVLNTWVESLTSVRGAIQSVVAEIAIEHGAEEDWTEQNIEFSGTVQKKYEKINAALEKTNEIRERAKREAAGAGLFGRQKDIAIEESRFEAETSNLLKERRETLAALDKNSSEYRQSLTQFGDIQKDLEKKHDSRLQEINLRREMSNIRLPDAHADAHLTGLKERAEEQFALLHKATDPVTAAIERGNAIDQQGFKDVVAAVAGKGDPAAVPPSTPAASDAPRGDTKAPGRSKGGNVTALHDRQWHREQYYRDREMLGQLQEQDESTTGGPDVWRASRAKMIEKLKARMPHERDVAEFGTAENARLQREVFNDTEGTRRKLAREREDKLAPFRQHIVDLEKAIPDPGFDSPNRDRILAGAREAYKNALGGVQIHEEAQHARLHERNVDKYRYALPRIATERARLDTPVDLSRTGYHEAMQDRYLGGHDGYDVHVGDPQGGSRASVDSKSHEKLSSIDAGIKTLVQVLSHRQTQSVFPR